MHSICKISTKAQEKATHVVTNAHHHFYTISLFIIKLIHVHMMMFWCNEVNATFAVQADLTPLHYAIEKGHSETVKLLLELGADMNVQSMVCNYTHCLLFVLKKYKTLKVPLITF